MTIDKIRDLAHAYLTARAETRAHYKTKPEPFDLDEEHCIRWQIKRDRLINQQVRLESPYRDACDKFFAIPETVEAA